ncbi:MAG TPA: FAD-dependent oxidoreductase [Candidatus Aquicultor sp.]
MDNRGAGSTGNEAIIPGKSRSLWIATTPDTDFPSLKQGIEVDSVVLGGGIVGISVASMLKEAGQTVAVIEMRQILKGVTGHTTAKITSLQGLHYHRMLRYFSADDARTYAEANQVGIDHIADTVEHKHIDCDFKRAPAYTYTEQANNVSAIKAEAKAAQMVGLPVSYVEEAPLPFPIKAAVVLHNQGQFHPRKYLLALANEIPGDGSYIFENTRALNIAEGEPCEVITNKGTIKGKNVVLATAFPFYDKGQFFARLYPYYAYALGVYVRGDVPEGMYYTEDGEHFSLRNQPTDKGTILIIGGGSHKTGQGKDILKHYRDIEHEAKERFDVKSIDYYWSTEDYRTADTAPYIGKSPHTDHVYLATGFDGWGMANSTASAILLADEVLGRDNPWKGFFNPSRHELSSFGKRFASEGLNIVEQYAKRVISQPEHKNPEDLDKGEGEVVLVDHKKVAVHKDEDGTVYKLSPNCTHLGCPLSWNNAELTWDCTCHGSRFTAKGEVIHGPALANLPEEDSD